MSSYHFALNLLSKESFPLYTIRKKIGVSGESVASVLEYIEDWSLQVKIQLLFAIYMTI